MPEVRACSAIMSGAPRETGLTRYVSRVGDDNAAARGNAPSLLERGPQFSRRPLIFSFA